MQVCNKKFSWTNSIRYKSNRYLLGTLDTKGEYDPQFIDYQTFISWRPSKRWEVGFIGNISENKYIFQSRGPYHTIRDIRTCTRIQSIL